MKYFIKSSFVLLIFCLFPFVVYTQTYIDGVSVEQLTDGSGLVKICYKAHNIYDSTIAVNTQASFPDTGIWNISVITILDTLSGYSSPNQGWRVSASSYGIEHCFLWNMGSDIGDAQECGFRMRFAVFDSILPEYSVVDSYQVMDTLEPWIQTFGLGYRHGQLWILFHNDSTHDCWVRPYSMPDVVPGDSFHIGSVTVGPSDMTFAGDRLFWTEDTRTLLKEYDFETGESNVVRGDWWDLPGTSNHLAGAAFDGENLWVCFCEGTFIALDTADFSLVDTMFFSDFGASIPASCADGLAWGLGLLWCYSNDNIVYGIDVHEKRIVYEIPTGSVVLATGAEGAAWDGTNLWVLDYGRGFLYKISLFHQIRFYYSPEFCFDNVPPIIEWHLPSCPDFADTFVGNDTAEIIWSVQDSNLSGGRTILTIEDDSLAELPATDTTYEWSVFPWFGWDGAFDISIWDSFGNHSSATSCLFMISPYNRVDKNKSTPEKLSISAYPNPFNSSVEIMVSDGRGLVHQIPTNIAIYDVNGNVVYAPSIPRSLSPRGEREDEKVENGSPSPLGEGFRMRGKFIWTPDKSIPSGIYFVRATMNEGQMITKRIVYIK